MKRPTLAIDGQNGEWGRNVSDRFADLTEAVIDASSIIYMLKAGFLGLLGSTIGLKTIPSVFAETGWPSLPVTVADEDDDDRPNDEKLLDFAVRSTLPVISDDRALLLAAERNGLDYYNSLMMLAFVRYRRRIDEAWYDEAFGRLLEIGRYNDEILGRFDEIANSLFR